MQAQQDEGNNNDEIDMSPPFGIMMSEERKEKGPEDDPVHDADVTRPRDGEKQVFLLLDPRLKLLITSIEYYRKCVDADDSHKESMKSRSREEELLELLRFQMKLMEQLQNEIQQISQQSDRDREHLAAMADYLTLPLGLLLGTNRWDATKASGTSEVLILIRQSALWKTVQTAADTLRIYAAACGESSLTATQIVKYVAACAIALPVEQRTPIAGQMDHGDTCVAAILQCIDVLLQVDATDQMHLPPTTIVKIVRGCLLSLSAPNSKEGSTADNLPHTASSRVQLQALNTLQCLMRTVPEESVWKKVLPGCFGALFRLIVSQLRPSTQNASSKVTAGSIITLSQLLSVACRSYRKDERKDIDKKMQIALAQMQALGATREGQTVSPNVEVTEPNWEGSNVDDSRAESIDQFRQEVNSRLPGPLTVLMNVLPSAASASIRRAAPILCRCVLIETRYIWDSPSPAIKLRQAAMECCLVLNTDRDERAASIGRSTVGDCQHDLGIGEWQKEIATVVGPRVIDLLKEISILTRSQREVELRTKLKLICGYLDMATSTESLGKSLVLGSVSDDIRKILVAMFDMDFESVQYSHVVAKVTRKTGDGKEPTWYRCQFLSAETEEDARRMLQTLGRCLGTKRASLFVDALLSDLFQAAVDRAETGCSMHSVAHTQWLHEWVGSVVVAHEILVGAFGSVSASSKHQRAHKRLLSLCRAVFPVMTSPPLWTLPTAAVSTETVHSGHSIPSKSLAELLDLSEKRGHAVSHVCRSEETDDGSVSASALKGNAVLVGSLVQLVGKMVSLAGKESESFLPMLLYPLCEKSGSRNHSQVQNVSSVVLEEVAQSCGELSSADLLRSNFDYLFRSVLSKLHLPIGRSSLRASDYPSDIASIALAILRKSSSCATNEPTNAIVPHGKRSLTEETSVSYVIEAVTSLVAIYDRSFLGVHSGDYFVASSLELVQTLYAVVEYFAATMGIVTGALAVTDPARGDRSEQPWLELLQPFLLEFAGENRDDEHDCLSPDDAFNKMREQRDAGSDGSSRAMEISSGELGYLELMLRRCGFLLSLSSLKVQVAACAAMKRCFEVLGFIAFHYKPSEDEVNGPKTAIYRHIADAWPAVLSQLNVTASSVVHIGSTRAVSLRRQSPRLLQPAVQQDVSTHTAFASRLFDLVASMAEASDSFMVDRLKNFVWPIIKKLLGHYLDGWTSRSEARYSDEPFCSSVDRKEPTTSKLQVTEKDRLLWNLFGFIRRIFRQRDCGAKLASLIPETGTLLLPFLSDTAESGDGAMETIKVLLEIDGDALWRALVVTSGRHGQLPPLPFATPKNLLSVDTSPRIDICVASSPSTLQRRAAELMEYANTLPEQPFEE